MLVKNATIEELAADLCVEGHPALWFISIAPLIRAGLSFRFFFAFSVVLTAVAFFLLLDYAPFPYWTRLLIIFSSCFWYYNPVIPRIYSEATLLLIIIGICYPRRESHPWIYGFLLLLLAQSHILLEGLTVALVLECFRRMLNHETMKKAVIPFSMGVVSGIVALIELFPRSGTKRAVDVSASGILSNFTKERVELLSTVTLNSLFGLSEKWMRQCFIVFCVAGSCLILLVCIREWGIRRTINGTVIAFISLGVPLFIVFFVYSIHEQMATVFLMIVLLLLFMVWNVEKGKKAKNTILAFIVVLCLATFPVALRGAVFDVNENYSNSKNMADYIMENVEEGAIIFVNDNEYNAPVCGYVSSERQDISFYNIQKKETYRFHVWGEMYPPVNAVEAKATALNMFHDKDVYWLLPYALEDETSLDTVKVCNEYNFTQEYYVLYRVMGKEN